MKTIEEYLIDIGDHMDSYCEDIVYNIVWTARQLWEECPSDFCIQTANTECIVFGGTNRVVWHFLTGFRLDKSYCTDKFIEHYERVMK